MSKAASHINSEGPLSFGDKVVYLLLSGCAFVIGLLPFRAVYILSDLLAWLAGDLLRYRRKVVEQNLRSAFPDKDKSEIAAISGKFYRFLTDYFLETAKMGTMSRKTIMKRMRFEGIEEVSRRLAAGENVSLLLGHYGNWEWVSSLPLHFPEEAGCGQIYHVLHSRGADRFFLRLRSHFGATSIPMAETLRVLIGWQRQGKPSVVGYIADQAPKMNSIHHWMDFLNHDTPVFTGPERISRKLHCSVYYLEMTRPKRGYYVGRFVEICRDAATEPELEVTEKYFHLLEQTIAATPQYWLWSHKRWKRSRADYEASAKRKSGL